MNLILVLVLLFCSNVKSTSIKTTTVESPPDVVPKDKPPLDVFQREMNADCIPKYEGFLVNSKEITVENNKKKIEYKCLNEATYRTTNLPVLTLGVCKHEYQYCTDGSLRRVKFKHDEEEKNNKQLCVRNEETNEAIIKQMDCRMIEEDPKLDNPQKWEITEAENVIQEDGSIVNIRKLNIKSKDGKCLTVKEIDDGIWIHGKLDPKMLKILKMADCIKNKNEQNFYFRTRGTVLKQGNIYNRHQDKCIHPISTDNAGSQFGSCDDVAGNHAVKYYTNGEIIANDQCFTSLFHDSIGLEDCRMDKAQKWVIDKCNKNGSCLIMNASTRKCFKYQGRQNTYLTSDDCAIGMNSFFDFVNGNWNTRKDDWVKLSCNQDGKLSVEIKNEIKLSDGTKISDEHELELKVAGKSPFLETDVTVSHSFGWEKAWEENFETSTKSSMTCDHYEDSITDNDKFTHGCIWQLKLTTFNRKKSKNLEWRPPIVKCTRSGEPPKCAVFMKCKNQKCDKCIHENEESDVEPSPTGVIGQHLLQKHLRRKVHK